MLRFSKRLFIANLFGALFYLGCLMQWLWSLLPFMPGIISFIQSLQAPMDTPVEPVAPIAAVPPSPLVTLLGVAVVVIVIGIVIYVIVKAPTAIGKTGHKVTASASSYIVPVVSQHKKLTPSKRRQLTARVIAYVKLALAVLPVILSACAYFIATELSYDVIMLVAAMLGISTLVGLCLQLGAAKLLSVRLDKIW